MTCEENLPGKLTTTIQEEFSLLTDMIETTNESNTSSSFLTRCFPCGFRDEAIKLIKITIPFALGNILATWLISFISLALVGQAHGQLELNACALAMATYVLIANSLMLGLNFGCDTLLPQCLGGNKRKMGLIVQRALLITGYSCLISWTLLLNAKYFLKVIEHDQNVVRIADKILRSYLLVVPFDGLSMLLQKYIACNEKTWPLLVINTIGNLVNVGFNYLFLYKLHMKAQSVPFSITISYAVIVLCAFLYIRFSSIYRETWHPINRSCLEEWNTYLKLSIPGIFLVMTEFWSIELSIYFAALLGARSLSAQVCAYQTAWLFYLITSSFATAANIRIGQFLGGGKPLQAANTKNVTFAVGAMIIVINMCLIVIGHYWFPLAYNTGPDALKLARRVLLLIALFQIWDAYNVYNTGILKACGQQKRGAMISLCGFYVFGIPIAAVLMFYVRIDIFGFWIGIIAAETVTNALLFTLIQRFNWEGQAKAASIRIQFKTKDATTSIATVTDLNEKENEIKEEQQPTTTDENHWKRSIRIKILVFLLLVCFLIAGIVTSIVIRF